MIYTFPIEIDGSIVNYNPLKGIDTQQDLDVARIAVEIEDIAERLSVLPQNNYYAAIALSEKLRKETK